MFIVASALAISDLDKRASRYLLSLSLRHDCARLAKRVSSTGDGPFYLLLTLALLVIHAEGEIFFDTALAAFIIELPLYLLLKNTIRRTRPCYQASGLSHCHSFSQDNGLKGQDEALPVIGFEPSDRFSFPSGHTAAAFVMATTISMVYPGWVYVAYLWALAIGLSRVLLGVHYPLDILAGAILGGSSVYLIQSIM